MWESFYTLSFPPRHSYTPNTRNCETLMGVPPLDLHNDGTKAQFHIEMKKATIWFVPGFSELAIGKFFSHWKVSSKAKRRWDNESSPVSGAYRFQH